MKWVSGKNDFTVTWKDRDNVSFHEVYSILADALSRMEFIGRDPFITVSLRFADGTVTTYSDGQWESRK